MLYDSTFLIHLSGQRGKNRLAAAEAFLAAHPGGSIYTSRLCWSEFAEGCETLDEVERGLFRFDILAADEAVAWRASRIARTLSRTGLHIGDNDIWIAATALVYDLPLVTLNEKHYGRITGLKVETY
jgi:tRNA(fMet)-specific endonuclease VapC